MKPEWIPLFLILGFILFQLVLNLSYPIWVLLHELAHALPALFRGKPNVRINIGEGPTWFNVPLPRMTLSVHRYHHSRGSTTYDGTPRSHAEACFIILPAPLLSASIALGFGWFIYQIAPTTNPVALLVLTAAWLANFHITFSAWWPIANPRSDLIDLLKQLGNL